MCVEFLEQGEEAIPKCEHGLTSKECYVCASPKHAEQAEKQVVFKIYKPTLPRGAIPNVRDAELPWVYDQDPWSGNVASMWVTPVKATPQPQQAEKQEPVPWKGCDLDGMVEAFDRVIEAHFFRKNPFHNPIDADAQMALRILRGFIPYMKQYTTPQPQREWVGLTDNEMLMIYGQQHEGKKYSLGRMVEQALKEKNT